VRGKEKKGKKKIGHPLEGKPYPTVGGSFEYGQKKKLGNHVQQTTPPQTSSFTKRNPNTRCMMESQNKKTGGFEGSGTQSGEPSGKVVGDKAKNGRGKEKTTNKKKRTNRGPWEEVGKEGGALARKNTTALNLRKKARGWPKRKSQKEEQSVRGEGRLIPQKPPMSKNTRSIKPKGKGAVKKPWFFKRAVIWGHRIRP